MGVIFKHVIFILLSSMGIFSQLLLQGVESKEHQCFLCAMDGLDNNCNKGINLKSTFCGTNDICTKTAYINKKDNEVRRVSRGCNSYANLRDKHKDFNGTDECEEVKNPYVVGEKLYICNCKNSINCNTGWVWMETNTTTNTTTTNTSIPTTTITTPNTNCVQSFNEQWSLFQFLIISLGVGVII